MLTTATPTGRARAHALFGAEIDVRYLPYDTPGAVRRFLDRIRPQVAVIIETELWPNLVHECRRRGMPVVFASARLTERSVSRYRRLGALFRGRAREQHADRRADSRGCGALHRRSARTRPASVSSAT